LSRRPAQGRPDARGDTDAAAIKATIGRLLRLLGRKPAIAGHPAVAPDIGRLTEWLATSEQAGHAPGRHRANSRPGSGRPGQEADLELELELAAVRAPAEFVAQLQRQIDRSGLTLREVAAAASQKRVYSTISAALSRDSLPTIGVVEAVIIGCGRDEHVLSLFAATWQRLKSGNGSGPGSIPGILPAPVPPMMFFLQRI
jgi:hypothetical protein